ncbi:MAG: helix-turn-helix domain-containing protein, partial [Candidatus Binatia bacterium]
MPSRPINPDMIAVARESRMLTQTEFATKLSIPQGHLSKIESGIMPVTEDLLERIAKELEYSEDLFSVEDATFGAGPSLFFHRKRESLSQRILKYMHAQIKIKSIQIKKLLQQGNIRVSIRKLDIDEFNGDVEQIAMRLRAHLGLEDGPIQSVTRTIEGAGGIIIEMDFETRLLDAVSIWPPELAGPIFFVNKNVPPDRLRFTLCHELGHMVMHHLSINPNLKEVEQEANLFAGAFLMPRKEIAPSLSKVTLQKLAVLKRYWKVSMGALIERASQLNKITERTRQYLWTQMSKAGYKTKEPLMFDGLNESPNLLKEIIDVH